MTVTNEELVQKAVITAEDALSTTGKLNPKQADRFLDYVVDETVLKNNARIHRFRNEVMELNKVGIGRRVTLAKQEGVDPGVRMGVSMDKIQLQPKTVIVPVEVSDEFGEINLEGPSLQDRLMRMFAAQMANDLEEFYLMGNTLGAAQLQSDLIPDGSTTQYIKDSFLGLGDGLQVRANDGHTIDAEGANIGLSIFGALLRALPTKFRRDKKNLRFYMSPDLAQLYLEKLSTRNTKTGDDAVTGGVAYPFGVPIVEVPLWPLNPLTVEHVTLNGTTAVSLESQNISNVRVLPANLGKVPTDAYIETTDYVVDTSLGTIARTGAGAIGDGDTVKVTYDAAPQIICTHRNNFLVAIGRDLRMEKDRDIYKGTNQFVITAKVDVNIEHTDALSKAINVGDAV